MAWPLPWYLGALAMAAMTVGFWLLVGRPLGVSACWARLVNIREERRLSKVEAQVAANPEAFQRAMLEATLAEFGEVAQSGPPPPATASAAVEVRAPWTAHLVFLVCLGLGGALAAWSRGTLAPSPTLGPDFERYFGEGPLGWAVLVGGGLLVGFGTRMCGGCSSGHGLSGCSRLQPGSLVSTAAFFGSGVAAALLLSRWLS